MLSYGMLKCSTAALFFLMMVFFGAGTLTASEEILILRHDGETVLLPNFEEGNSREKYIELKLTGSGSLILENQGETAALDFSIGAIPEKIYLYRNLTGFYPERIIINHTDSDFDILSAGILSFTPEQRPVSADIGHILFSEFDPANNPPQELRWRIYRWNLYPEIIIFDTADYSVQANLFKRLAFFVEKPGFTGKLLRNEELKGKHGWNAHDYKAEDLAAFFSRAELENFILNEEELHLKEVLLNEGIILDETGDGRGYKGGEGAVLSVSRETEVSWRYRFLTHECLHGIFFTDEAFRSDIFQVYEDLRPEEKRFWDELLDYRRYDISNSYLVVNEFMAFSLQQPPEETDEYFKGFLYKRMTAARPEKITFVEDFDRTFPDSFNRSVRNLAEVLYKYTGRSAGYLSNLQPAWVTPSFFDLFPSL
jgi:hypothetical protein